MKPAIKTVPGGAKRVAPFAGAWIETVGGSNGTGNDNVAPFAGAWIETPRDFQFLAMLTEVAPFAGAWIETCEDRCPPCPGGVAPFAGAWIETSTDFGKRGVVHSRTLRGCVD